MRSSVPSVAVPQAEVIMHGASGRQILGQRAPLAHAGAQNVHHAVDHLAPIATRRLPPPGLPGATLKIRAARYAPIPHRSGRSDNAVCRGCSAGGCRQSTWGTSRGVNSPPQRITADSALQEGPPDKGRFIRLMVKSPDLESLRSRIYRKYYKVFILLPRLGFVNQTLVTISSPALYQSAVFCWHACPSGTQTKRIGDGARRVWSLG